MAAEPIPAELATACPSVRQATPDDAVAGLRPSFVAAPASTEQASAILRAAAAMNLAVVPRGTGTRLHWGTPPERCDLVIDMTQMDRVIEHEAGDLVATVQAGTGLDRLAGVLGQAGQRLALDPPGLGTVGGVLAAGVAGPLRLRYGTPRDLLIGITVVRADGIVARSGGKVVKNVAGYDLGKLFAGSRGTLGLITEATFRLHPVPAATRYVTVECASAAQACELIAAVMDAPLMPVAAEIDWPGAGSPVRLGFAVEGTAAATAQRSAAMTDLLARHGRVSPNGAASQHPPSWWARPVGRPGGTAIQVAFWPGALGAVLAELRAAAAATGLDPAVGGSAAAGIVHGIIPSEADPGGVAAFVAGLRSALGHTGQAQAARANVVVLSAPAAVLALVDPFGPVPSLGLMRAVKHQFDPDRRMAPGRFAGGI